VLGIEDKGKPVRGRRVLQFGAGGAGSAIACALVGAGVESIRIVDPESGRVEALATALRKAFPGCDVAAASAPRADADMIVNASPIGMRPDDGMPADLGALAAGTLVGDVVISEAPTALIRHAQRYGCTWANGRDMHSGQVDALLNFFAPGSPPSGRAVAG
jgi:shikimate dehydrogenase